MSESVYFQGKYAIVTNAAEQALRACEAPDVALRQAMAGELVGGSFGVCRVGSWYIVHGADENTDGIARMLTDKRNNGKLRGRRHHMRQGQQRATLDSCFDPPSLQSLLS